MLRQKKETHAELEALATPKDAKVLESGRTANSEVLTTHLARIVELQAVEQQLAKAQSEANQMASKVSALTAELLELCGQTTRSGRSRQRLLCWMRNSCKWRRWRRRRRR